MHQLLSRISLTQIAILALQNYTFKLECPPMPVNFVASDFLFAGKLFYKVVFMLINVFNR